MRIGDVGPKGRILIRGESGHDNVDELSPLDGEVVIDKPAKGSFYATDLHQLLETAGITSLVVTGVTTEVCLHHGPGGQRPRLRLYLAAALTVIRCVINRARTLYRSLTSPPPAASGKHHLPNTLTRRRTSGRRGATRSARTGALMAFTDGDLPTRGATCASCSVAGAPLHGGPAPLERGSLPVRSRE